MRCVSKQHRDSQRRRERGVCARCGREWWQGDPCWHINGALLCKACLLDYALGLFAPHREEGEP